MDITMILVLFIITCFTAVYYYKTYCFKFWKSRGVVEAKSSALFGSTTNMILGKQGLTSFLATIYDEYRDEPLVGLYFMRKPALVVHDLNLIRDILRKDFTTFSHRGLDTDKFDLLSHSLLVLRVDKWRPLRSKLSPAFTSGKLKDMFYLLVQCASDLNEHIKNIDNNSVDVIEMCRKYTTDAIGICVFGLQANTLRDENSVLKNMAKRLFRKNYRAMVKDVLQQFPMIYNLVGAFLQDDEMINFFLNLTKDTLAYRRKHKVLRHDFVDLLMAIQNAPQTVGDIEITDEYLAAQLFIFFAGGFETSASTMSATLYELAMNPSVQQKLREEIVETLNNDNGETTYNNVKNMKYLDAVVNEALRKYPPIPVIIRQSVEPYTFADRKVTVPKDQIVLFSLYSIQRDLRYFVDPEKFIPERFDRDNFENHPEMAFLPFGDGPRNCIGARFAKMQVKTGLISVIKSYAVEVCEKTDPNFELDEAAFFTTPKNGIYLNLKKLES